MNVTSIPTPQSTNMDSPFDMTKYLAFPSASGGALSQPPSANILNQASSSSSAGTASASAGNQMPAGNDELYIAFARGIAETDQKSNRQQQQPHQPHQQRHQSYAQPPYQSQPSSHAHAHAHAHAHPHAHPHPQSHNHSHTQRSHQKEPSPVERSSSQASNSKGHSGSTANHSSSNMSPYGLDPAAFQSEVRFQLPAFMNPSASAPTYPNGAEAFSGYGLNASEAMDSMFTNFGGGGSGSGSGSGAGGAAVGRAGDGNILKWKQADQPMMPPPAPTPASQSASQQQQTHHDGSVHRDTSGPGRWDDWNANKQPSVLSQPDSLNSTQYTFNNDGSMAVQHQQQQQHQTQHQQQQHPHQPHHPPQSNVNHPTTIPTSALLPPRPDQGPDPNSTFASSSSGNSAVAADLLSTNGLSGLVQPGTLATTTPDCASMPGLYSTTGFDIVGVLSKVAARRDPKTVLGPVDCSCSFTVVDVRKFDNPIVYASPTFCQLTGYESNEIVGKNCRFLQSPDGNTPKGSRRKYTDNAAVFHILKMLQAGKECQASLINYKKGGMPFINLVTVVPIPWDGDDIVYHVGFQVDLVEQPNAILRNMRDGSYQVNYTVLDSNPPPPVYKPPPPPRVPVEPVNGLGSIDSELFKLLPKSSQSSVYNGPEDSGKMEWLKFVFENTDDFVHVLSLKGQFHYVSPSVRNVLEYEPDDLMNKHISDICHPSDIVPVMRELKDSTHSSNDGSVPSPFNLVFRVRRKHSGYIWLECHGRLHVEAGKGRKAVILTGRERSMSAVMWKSIQDHGGLGEIGFWGKISFDGLWLWASSTYRQVMGDHVRQEDLIGRSIFDSIDASSSKAVDIANALQQVCNGTLRFGATSIRHTLAGKDVVTTFYAVNNGNLDSSTPDFDGRSPSTSSSASTPARTLSEPSRAVGSPTNHILVQVKLADSPKAATKLFNTVVHPSVENVFEEMDTTRGTSWQYEMHQLRLSNRKIEDEINGIRNGTIIVEKDLSEDQQGKKKPSSTNKNKKRKSALSNDSKASRGALSVPVAGHPAPPHQQTPGFGLAPGNLFQTWNQ